MMLTVVAGGVISGMLAALALGLATDAGPHAIAAAGPLAGMAATLLAGLALAARRSPGAAQPCGTAHGSRCRASRGRRPATESGPLA